MNQEAMVPGTKLRKPLAKHRLRPADIHRFVEKLVGDDFHAKRVLSLSNGVTGAIHSATLGVHAIGQGLAQAQGLKPKHAIKQVDRLLSNTGIAVDDFFEHWVPFAIGAREDAYAALDWTEFDADDHCTIALYLVTSHGRATPLMWKTVTKSTIEGWRNDHEDDLLARFAKFRPAHLKRATVLADRGFGPPHQNPWVTGGCGSADSCEISTLCASPQVHRIPSRNRARSSSRGCGVVGFSAVRGFPTVNVGWLHKSTALREHLTR